jgi:hypothetical protein
MTEEKAVLFAGMCREIDIIISKCKSGPKWLVANHRFQ